MRIYKFLIFPLFLILLSSTVTSFSFASVESEAQEDILAGCRDGNTLVYRFAYNDFICVPPSTADRWVELGMAEIVSESESEPKLIEEEKPVPPKKYENAPTAPPQKRTTTDDSSECRTGYTLVYRFTHHDTLCISSSTAKSWERLGLVEIIKMNETTQEESDNQFISNSMPDTENSMINKETPESTDKETPESTDNLPELLFYNPYDLFSDNLNEIDEHMWVALDSNSISMIIEGEEGLVVIDSLSSFNSTKQILDELRTFTNKPVKTIIFTHINPLLLVASNGFIESNNDVNIILAEDVLDQFVDDYDLDIPNALTFSSEFEINVSGIPNMNIIFNDGFYKSDQTIIAFPKYDGVIIGDSSYGLFPFMMDLDSFRNLLD